MLQELCLGGTLAGLMQAGGLATPLGGVYVHRIVSLLLDVARGLMHLHACGHTGGDLDPSAVWLQLLDPEDEGPCLNSIDEDSIDTGARTVLLGVLFLCSTRQITPEISDLFYVLELWCARSWIRCA